MTTFDEDEITSDLRRELEAAVATLLRSTPAGDGVGSIIVDDESPEAEAARALLDSLETSAADLNGEEREADSVGVEDEDEDAFMGTSSRFVVQVPKAQGQILQLDLTHKPP